MTDNDAGTAPSARTAFDDDLTGAGDDDFAGEHDETSVGEDAEGGPEHADEEETPRGYAGMD